MAYKIPSFLKVNFKLYGEEWWKERFRNSARRRKRIVQEMKWMIALMLWFASGSLWSQAGLPLGDIRAIAPLDAQRESEHCSPC
jgi:hypothetical protein